VMNGNAVLHRVRVGPYRDQAKLEETRARLLNNNVDFMLLKLKVNDM
jgi:hypothetical protein